MPENLFGGFSAVSSKQWKQKIQYELSGADYSETLVWESPEGIKVKPFYHRDEDIVDYRSSSRENAFNICQDIFVFDVAKSAARALDTINRGAESLRFIIDDENTDVAQLLDKLPLDGKTVYFQIGFFSAGFVAKAEKATEGKNVTLFFDIDPISHLVKEGNWITGDAVDLAKLGSKSSTISVDGTVYHNAGANMVQQLAYTLAHLTEYLNKDINSDHPILIKMSVGSNYFFEIAKLRAMRMLYAAVASEFDFTAGCHIHVSPGKRNKTLYDFNVNMLRTTSECMSAIIGGADAVSNLPYDALYHKSNEFAERIARNQLLILKHESYFDKVENAADGSYYVESLTAQLAEKALILFKDIEAAGGFLAQLKEGTIQRKISESADKEQQLFDSGKEVLLGTNKQINKNDRMAHELELFPFVKSKSRKTLIAPVIERRLAENIEQQRIAAEKTQ